MGEVFSASEKGRESLRSNLFSAALGININIYSMMYRNIAAKLPLAHGGYLAKFPVPGRFFHSTFRAFAHYEIEREVKPVNSFLFGTYARSGPPLLTVRLIDHARLGYVYCPSDDREVNEILLDRRVNDMYTNGRKPIGIGRKVCWLGYQKNQRPYGECISDCVEGKVGVQFGPRNTEVVEVSELTTGCPVVRVRLGGPYSLLRERILWSWSEFVDPRSVNFVIGEEFVNEKEVDSANMMEGRDVNWGGEGDGNGHERGFVLSKVSILIDSERVPIFVSPDLVADKRSIIDKFRSFFQ